MNFIRTLNSLENIMPKMAVVLGLTMGALGCEQKEKVLDIKGPGIDIEVNKTSDGKQVEIKSKRDVEIKSDGAQKIEIDPKK